MKRTALCSLCRRRSLTTDDREGEKKGQSIMSRVTTRSSSRKQAEEALEEEVSHSGLDHHHLGRRNSIGLEAIDGRDDDGGVVVSPLRSMQNLEDVTLTLPATNDDDDVTTAKKKKKQKTKKTPNFSGKKKKTDDDDDVSRGEGSALLRAQRREDDERMPQSTHKRWMDDDRSPIVTRGGGMRTDDENNNNKNNNDDDDDERSFSRRRRRRTPRPPTPPPTKAADHFHGVLNHSRIHLGKRHRRRTLHSHLECKKENGNTPRKKTRLDRKSRKQRQRSRFVLRAQIYEHRVVREAVFDGHRILQRRRRRCKRRRSVRTTGARKKKHTIESRCPVDGGAYPRTSERARSE